MEPQLPAPESLLALVKVGGVFPLYGEPMVNATASLTLGGTAVSMGLSVSRLSFLTPPNSWVPKAAFSSMSDRRPVLSDLLKEPFLFPVFRHMWLGWLPGDRPRVFKSETVCVR